MGAGSQRWPGASLHEDRPGGPAPQDPPPLADSTTLEDGTRVLSIRIRAGRKPFDEQHTVTAPDGESRIFETSGETQTIRDGNTGEVLSQTTFTPTGLVAEPIAQLALAPTLPLIAAPVIATFELALQLLTYLSARKDGYGTVLGMSAQEYQYEDVAQPDMPMWIGRLNQAQLDATCPKAGEVQTIVDDVAARVKAQGSYASGAVLGTRIHAEIARTINSQKDPNFVAELILGERNDNESFIIPGSRRADIFENRPPLTACVYDTKTGREGLTLARVAVLIREAHKLYPDIERFIFIQVRPRR
ncbi:hypothetical protein MKL09_16095 [Methylobacterium sp. J-048]|uniref:hypothetical protein n=1 Tax=Methylobacterium sp. J-048 TaxID=2836635 RepID=UPI001FB94734|nr:hypothetical protein [Methylobacterium sp. J-048]MCJ2058074.1 hypothetical protein [Methylobacterium sp. J-048]